MNIHELSKMITPQPDGTPVPYLRTAVVVSTGVTWVIALDGVNTPATALNGVSATAGQSVQVLTKLGGPPLVLGRVGAPATQLFDTLSRPGGTTSGTTSLAVAWVTVPAQGAPGQVLVSVHAYITFTTANDTFECYICDSDATATRVASARVNVLSDAQKYANVAPHAVFTPDGTDIETYEFRLQRTAGGGTATSFADATYLRITALWIPT